MNYCYSFHSGHLFRYYTILRRIVQRRMYSLSVNYKKRKFKILARFKCEETVECKGLKMFGQLSPFTNYSSKLAVIFSYEKKKRKERCNTVSSTFHFRESSAVTIFDPKTRACLPFTSVQWSRDARGKRCRAAGSRNFKQMNRYPANGLLTPSPFPRAGSSTAGARSLFLKRVASYRLKGKRSATIPSTHRDKATVIHYNGHSKNSYGQPSPSPLERNLRFLFPRQDAIRNESYTSLSTPLNLHEIN